MSSGGLPLPTGEVELTFGNTFSKTHKGESFHSIRYDFKPASVDVNKSGTVVVGDRKEIEVTVPHVESSGTAETVFKGSKSAAAKECLLIIDHVTGHIILERFSQKLSVKKYRHEAGMSSKKLPYSLENNNRKLSPSQNYSPSQNLGGRSGILPSLSKLSPSQGQRISSPSYEKPTSMSQKSHSNAHATSMPSLGFDDEPKTMSDSSSDSDSSSSSSGSDSDSEPETNNKPPAKPVLNGHSFSRTGTVIDDLQLSDDDD